jgi:plasmid stabilization system protein ParE
VDALINAGLLAVDAVEEARNGTAPQVEDEEENDLDELAEWLAKQTWSEFAVSLAKQYAQRGSISPKQEAAAISMRNKVEAGRKRKAEAKAAAASDIDLSALPSGYYAVPGGGTRLKVRVARPTKASRWHGWTFVSDGAEYGSRKTYGKQGPEASARYEGAIQDELRAILANPFEAQKAYGKLWGVCGSCGRMLEDADSIAAGIGPICAMKW